VRLLARWAAGRTTTIDDIPENVLLDMFDFYRIIPMFPENVYSVWEWHVLAHVCRKWRQVVFASPERLGLRLICTSMTPVRKMLDIWPPTLPIIVENSAFLRSQSDGDDEDDSLIAALERRDRVCVITINHLTRHQLERLTAAMLEPFPVLTHLYLGSKGEEAPAVAPTLPATFMGGSAPRLQRLMLKGISFTALPNFVLSPENLTSIELRDIPSTGYVSPEEMVAFLSTLTRLGYLIIESKSPSPPADPMSRRAAPPTRVVFPALVYFRFKGVSEYLEDMVVGIDAPLLRDLDVVFFNQLIFAIPRLALFIHRTETLKSLSKQAELSFKSRHVLIKIFNTAGLGLSLCIPCSSSDWQISSIAQLCGPPLPIPSNVERLDIISEDTVDAADWQDVIDHAQWLDILRLFSSMRELYVTQTMWHVLAPNLKERAGERTMDTLPMLRDLFLEKLKPSESLPKTMEPFVAARKLAGHPVAVHRREGQTWTTQAVG
jgi:hypothetical protein